MGSLIIKLKVIINIFFLEKKLKKKNFQKMKKLVKNRVKQSRRKLIIADEIQPSFNS